MGLIMADFVKALGMISENMQRQQLDYPMAYLDYSFYEIADTMKNRIKDMDKKED